MDYRHTHESTTCVLAAVLKAEVGRGCEAEGRGSIHPVACPVICASKAFRRVPGSQRLDTVAHSHPAPRPALAHRLSGCQYGIFGR